MSGFWVFVEVLLSRRERPTSTTPKTNMIMAKENISEILPFPTVQGMLFDFLRPEQQAFIRPVLRAFKKKMQVQLCVALLDYMETGEAVVPENIQVGAAFFFLTRYGMEEDDKSDRRIIRPLIIRK